ncbi:MAG: hypothetical protein SFU55_02720 [Methylophilus sp.]|nr:hypothetical protein [Methylophilus sp.]
MAFEKMTNREQVLVFIVVGIFVLGAYGLVRYLPVNKSINELNASLEKNKQQVKSPKIPDEPVEYPEDLQERDALLEQQLVTLRNNMDTYEKNLAPIGNQDMVLKISEAARAANVKVIESVPYIVQRANGEATTVQNKPKLSKRAQRKVDREARKKARKTGSVVTSGPTGAQGAIPKEGELIFHLVNDFEEARPLQKISVEGAFSDLQNFIQAIANMPYQTTIVKLDIDVKIQTPPQGVPQPLMARMIIAM